MSKNGVLALDNDSLIVDMYLRGIGGPTISKELNVSKHVVYSALKDNNIVTRNNSEQARKYTCDEKFFSEIDNELSAYWLGLLYADGYITNARRTHSYQVGLSLGYKDMSTLEAFSNDIQFTGPIGVYESNSAWSSKVDSRYGRVLVSSDIMANDLISHGCTTNKTRTVVRPNISEELERHFIRGYIDGDGSIAKASDRRAGFKISIVGTQDLIEWIGSKLGKCYLGVEKRSDFVHILEKTLDDEVIDYLYEGSTRYMQRKFDRILLAKKNLSRPAGASKVFE